MPILLSVKKSSNPKKKWTALFRMPNTKTGKEKFKSVSFGSLSRHKSDLRTNDPLRAGFLAYYITWSGFKQSGKPTTSIPKLIRMYNKRFFKK